MILTKARSTPNVVPYFSPPRDATTQEIVPHEDPTSTTLPIPEEPGALDFSNDAGAPYANRSGLSLSLEASQNPNHEVAVQRDLIDDSGVLRSGLPETSNLNKIQPTAHKTDGDQIVPVRSEQQAKSVLETLLSNAKPAPTETLVLGTVPSNNHLGTLSIPGQNSAITDLSFGTFKMVRGSQQSDDTQVALQSERLPPRAVSPVTHYQSRPSHRLSRQKEHTFTLTLLRQQTTFCNQAIRQ